MTAILILSLLTSPPFSWQLCTLDKHSTCNLFSSLLTVCPASPHPLLFFYSVPQSFLFNIRPVQDKYPTPAKKRYSIEKESAMFIWSRRSGLNSASLWLYFPMCDGFHMGRSSHQQRTGEKSWEYTSQV